MPVFFAVLKRDHSVTNAQRDEGRRRIGTCLGRKEMAHSNWVIRGELRKETIDKGWKAAIGGV